MSVTATWTLLFRGVLLMQVRANGNRRIRIHRAIAFFDVPDDAFLIDDDIRALRPLILFLLHRISLQDAVRREHLFVHVAEQRKINVDLLGERGVGGG